jgi:hypothetical protein
MDKTKPPPASIRKRLSAVSLGETFGVPYTFNPDLTLVEAVWAVLFALSRIFLGSLVFALWGVCAWTTFAAIHNAVLRILAMLPILLLFLASMAILMIAITRTAAWIQRKRF